MRPLLEGLSETHCQGNWHETAGSSRAQLKEDRAASLSQGSQPTEAAVEISCQGAWVWKTHKPYLKEHFFGACGTSTIGSSALLGGCGGRVTFLGKESH